MSQSADQKHKRVAISKRLRFEIFKRDNFTCQYCGATPPGVILHCDHIEPVSKGGLTQADNLVTACQSCNSGKSDIRLSVVPQSLSDKAAEVEEREAQIAGYQAVLRARRERIDDDAQGILELFCCSYSREWIPKRDLASIKRFIEELGIDEVVTGAESACNKFYSGYERSFRYFCGICWNKIKRGDE